MNMNKYEGNTGNHENFVNEVLTESKLIKKGYNEFCSILLNKNAFLATVFCRDFK